MGPVGRSVDWAVAGGGGGVVDGGGWMVALTWPGGVPGAATRRLGGGRRAGVVDCRGGTVSDWTVALAWRWDPVVG